MTWIVTGTGGSAGVLASALLARGERVLVENRDFRDPSRMLQAVLGRSMAVLVRPDRIIHSHIASLGEAWRPLRSAS
jgi:hypothetical protein